MATAYGCRPSEIAGIEDAAAAFAFDEAVLAVGRRVEAAVREGGSVEKALRSFGRRRGEGRYRSVRQMPGARVRKMRIPESGVW